MAQEVECKLTIQNSEVALFTTRIEAYFPDAIVSEVHKEDLYYGLPDSTNLFRIRVTTDGIVVTQKYKELRSDGVEVNQETEFSVPTEDLGALKQFFAKLGYLPVVEKKKIGNSWQKGTLTIELVEVEQLGWFIEIEKLLDDNASEREINGAIEQLSEIRNELGLSDYPLQGRYYSEMLQDL